VKCLEDLHSLSIFNNFSRERLKLVESILRPTKESEGRYAFWLGPSISAGNSEVGIKVYLNPEIHGTKQAPDVLEASLKALGFASAWEDIKQRLALLKDVPGFPFISVDLTTSRDGRVKVYFSVNTWSSLKCLIEGAVGYSEEKYTRWIKTLHRKSARVLSPSPLCSFEI